MSDITLDAYLFFMGNCREAMEFYQQTFGGELSVQTYDDMPGNHPENAKGKVMHALLSGGDIRLMASDSTRTEPFGQSFISLSLSSTDETKIRELFTKLSEGGEVTSELKREFWGLFGSVTDKFGVEWMVNLTEEKN